MFSEVHNSVEILRLMQDTGKMKIKGLGHMQQYSVEGNCTAVILSPAPRVDPTHVPLGEKMGPG